MHTHRGIELFAERHGAERLVFGSGFRAHMGVSLAILALTDLEQTEREQIAHENLEWLPGLVPLEIGLTEAEAAPALAP